MLIEVRGLLVFKKKKEESIRFNHTPVCLEGAQFDFKIIQNYPGYADRCPAWCEIV